MKEETVMIDIKSNIIDIRNVNTVVVTKQEPDYEDGNCGEEVATIEDISNNRYGETYQVDTIDTDSKTLTASVQHYGADVDVVHGEIHETAETYYLEAEDHHQQDVVDENGETVVIQEQDDDGIEEEEGEEVVLMEEDGDDANGQLKLIKIRRSKVEILEAEEEVGGNEEEMIEEEDDVGAEHDEDGMKRTRKIAVIRIINEDGSTSIIHQEVDDEDEEEMEEDEAERVVDDEGAVTRTETIFIENEEMVEDGLIDEDAQANRTEEEEDEEEEEEDEEEEEEEDEGEAIEDDPDFDEDPDDPDYQVGYVSPEKITKKRKRKSLDDHKCPVCPKSFSLEASLKRHVTVCHPRDEKVNEDDPLAFKLCLCCGEPEDTAHIAGDFKCYECDLLFSVQKHLQRHHSMEHPSCERRDDGEEGVEDEITYSCCECDHVTPDKTDMIEHMKTHPIAKPYKCKHCSREFTRKYHLDRHISQKGCDGFPKDEFQCQVCDKTFTRKDNLRDHLRVHTGEMKEKKLVYCHYCNKGFGSSAFLTVHMRTHTGERPYKCDMCPKRFPSSGAMKKHRRMHTGEKPYECSQCKRRFAAKETLNRHFRTHTGEKPHSCQFCGKSFIQAIQLRAHIFHHTGENAFTCPHCDRAFNRRVRLTTHIKFVHEGAKPIECTECSKTFFRKEDLARHMIKHTGEKPFECTTCKKRFAVKSSLNTHMLTHRKEQPCSCDECGRAFIRQDCLLRHMRAKHRDILEDIMAEAEKKRLQKHLLSVASQMSNSKVKITETKVWDELTFTNSVKELLSLLVDESTLNVLGWPNTPVDKLLDLVIKRCGHEPASTDDFDYLGRLRENAKLLFTVVIDDDAVKSLLNNQTVDEVIMHVLKLAKGPQDDESS